MIFGVALLAGCMFAGSLIGRLLGLLTGFGSDIGGVGFAMMLLLVLTNSKKVMEKFPSDYKKGLDFWQEMYIPVTIAMASSQNVFHALSGGLIAVVAGLCAVFTAFALIPVINRISQRANESSKKEGV